MRNSISDKIIRRAIIVFIVMLPIFPAISLVAFLIAIVYLLKTRWKDVISLKPRIFLYALVGLVLCMGLSTVFSTDRLKSLVGFIVFLSYPLAAVLLAFNPQKNNLRALTIGGIIIVIFSIIKWAVNIDININFDLFSSIPVSIRGPAIGLHRNNRFARFLVLALPLSVALFLRERDRKWKFISISFIMLGLFSMFLTTSLAGIGTIIIFAILFIAIKNWKIALAVVVLLCIFTVTKPDTARYLIGKCTSKQSVGRRVITWKEIVVPMVRDHPLTGCGLLNYPSTSYNYRGEGYLHAHAHSLYFHYLAETGILGFLSLFIVIAIFFKVSKSAKKNSPIALACSFSILGGLIHGTMETIFEFLPIGLLFWIVIGIGIGKYNEDSLS